MVDVKIISQFTIDGRLPSLNEYTRVNRRNRYEANKLKQKSQMDISIAIKNAHIKPIDEPIMLFIKWYEKDAKRDVDNIISAKKFILDALVNECVLKDDGRKYVKQCFDIVATDKENPRIEVALFGGDDIERWLHQVIS